MSDILNVLGIPNFWSVIIWLGIALFNIFMIFMSIVGISSNLTKIINRLIKADADKVNLRGVEQDWIFNALFWLTMLVWAFSRLFK